MPGKDKAYDSDFKNTGENAYFYFWKVYLILLI